MKPTTNQKKVFNEWFNTTNYIYNKTIEYINKGHKALDFQGLRDLLVTNETKKNNSCYDDLVKEIKKLEKEKRMSENKTIENKEEITRIEKEIFDLKLKKKNLPIEKNNAINKWELKTPKEIRAGAVKDRKSVV